MVCKCVQAKRATHSPYSSCSRRRPGGAKLAAELNADAFIILTDGGGIWKNFGKPDAKEMKQVTPEYLLG